MEGWEAEQGVAGKGEFKEQPLASAAHSCHNTDATRHDCASDSKLNFEITGSLQRLHACESWSQATRKPLKPWTCAVKSFPKEKVRLQTSLQKHHFVEKCSMTQAAAATRSNALLACAVCPSTTQMSNTAVIAAL